MTLPLTGIDRFYVMDVKERIDDRLRAVTLLTPFLWDNYTIAWELGGVTDALADRCRTRELLQQAPAA